MSKLDILQLGDPRLHQVCTGLDAGAPSTVALVVRVPGGFEAALHNPTIDEIDQRRHRP